MVNTKVLDSAKDPPERINLSPDSEFLQVATIRMGEGHTFKPHKHFWRQRPTHKRIPQESWIVIAGTVKAILYDLNDTILKSVMLKPGDCSITFQGGHNYVAMEPGTIVYEVKTGPYEGQENDKRFINE